MADEIAKHSGFSAACAGKIPYDSANAGMKTINGIFSKHKGKGKKKDLRVYHCPFCDKYHIGQDKQKHVKKSPHAKARKNGTRKPPPHRVNEKTG